MDMFIRFTVKQLNEDSCQPLGVLHAIRYLRDDGKLTSSQLKLANKIFDWLFDNLEAPNKKILQKNPTAVSWFRDGAKRHIKQVERLIPIAEAHGHKVIRRTCLNPGSIIYSDSIQVFAKPRKHLANRCS